MLSNQVLCLVSARKEAKGPWPDATSPSATQEQAGAPQHCCAHSQAHGDLSHSAPPPEQGGLTRPMRLAGTRLTRWWQQHALPLSPSP